MRVKGGGASSRPAATSPRQRWPPSAAAVPGERIVELRTGGTVIGPWPQVCFRRGRVRLNRESVLVLFAHAINREKVTEARCSWRERLKRVVPQSHGAPAGHLIDRILDVAFALGEERPGRTR